MAWTALIDCSDESYGNCLKCRIRKRTYRSKLTQHGGGDLPRPPSLPPPNHFPHSVSRQRPKIHQQKTALLVKEDSMEKPSRKSKDSPKSRRTQESELSQTIASYGLSEQTNAVRECGLRVFHRFESFNSTKFHQVEHKRSSSAPVRTTMDREATELLSVMRFPPVLHSATRSRASISPLV